MEEVTNVTPDLKHEAIKTLVDLRDALQEEMPKYGNEIVEYQTAYSVFGMICGGLIIVAGLLALAYVAWRAHKGAWNKHPSDEILFGVFGIFGPLAVFIGILILSANVRYYLEAKYAPRQVVVDHIIERIKRLR